MSEKREKKSKMMITSTQNQKQNIQFACFVQQKSKIYSFLSYKTKESCKSSHLRSWSDWLFGIFAWKVINYRLVDCWFKLYFTFFPLESLLTLFCWVLCSMLVFLLFFSSKTNCACLLMNKGKLDYHKQNCILRTESTKW